MAQNEELFVPERSESCYLKDDADIELGDEEVDVDGLYPDTEYTG
jgi:hypothetical protein